MQIRYLLLLRCLSLTGLYNHGSLLHPTPLRTRQRFFLYQRSLNIERKYIYIYIRSTTTHTIIFQIIHTRFWISNRNIFAEIETHQVREWISSLLFRCCCPYVSRFAVLFVQKYSFVSFRFKEEWFETCLSFLSVSTMLDASTLNSSTNITFLFTYLMHTKINYLLISLFKPHECLCGKSLINQQFFQILTRIRLEQTIIPRNFSPILVHEMKLST